MLYRLSVNSKPDRRRVCGLDPYTTTRQCRWGFLAQRLHETDSIDEIEGSKAAARRWPVGVMSGGSPCWKNNVTVRLGLRNTCPRNRGHSGTGKFPDQVQNNEDIERQEQGSRRTNVAY